MRISVRSFASFLGDQAAASRPGGELEVDLVKEESDRLDEEEIEDGEMNKDWGKNVSHLG